MRCEMLNLILNQERKIALKTLFGQADDIKFGYGVNFRYNIASILYLLILKIVLSSCKKKIFGLRKYTWENLEI